MLSFPPHCSHKLQPVDRSVNGPLKKAVNSACDAWMRSNPGSTMTIYHIPTIVSRAYLLAMTPNNVQAGFRCTGVYPYNRDIFTELDFCPSFVSDRPIPGPQSINFTQNTQRTNGAIPENQFVFADGSAEDESAHTTCGNASSPIESTNVQPCNANSSFCAENIGDFPIDPLAETEIPNEIVSAKSLTSLSGTVKINMHSTENTCSSSKDPSATGTITLVAGPSTSIATTDVFSPERVRPLPKAPPRKTTSRGRKKRKTAIWTDTPEKESIRKEQEVTERRRKTRGVKKNMNRLNEPKPKRKKPKKQTKEINPESEDGEDECFCLVCMESFASSRPNEQWIQCIHCHLWAHEQCTPLEAGYICHNCESE